MRKARCCGRCIPSGLHRLSATAGWRPAARIRGTPWQCRECGRLAVAPLHPDRACIGSRDGRLEAGRTHSWHTLAVPRMRKARCRAAASLRACIGSRDGRLEAGARIRGTPWLCRECGRLAVAAAASLRACIGSRGRPAGGRPHASAAHLGCAAANAEGSLFAPLHPFGPASAHATAWLEAGRTHSVAHLGCAGDAEAPRGPWMAPRALDASTAALSFR